MYVRTNIHRYIHMYAYTCIYTYVYRSIYANVSMRDSMSHYFSLVGHSRVYRRAHVYRDSKVEGQRGRKDVGQSGAMSEEMGGG